MFAVNGTTKIFHNGAKVQKYFILNFNNHLNEFPFFGLSNLIIFSIDNQTFYCFI